MIVTDASCQPFSAAEMDWTKFSAAQKAQFEAGYRLQIASHFSEAIKNYASVAGQLQNFAVFYNLGLCEAAIGDLGNAEAHLKQSAQLNSQNRETYKLLSKVQDTLGKTAEAKATKDKYLKL